MSRPVDPGALVVPAGRGLPHGMLVPREELVERFSRSSGPGGQSVNTTDSRVELLWDVRGSAALTDEQRARLLGALRTVDGAVSVVASEYRSQLANRRAARARLVAMIRDAMLPPVVRRATRPSRAARERRLDAKRRRSRAKAVRSRVDPD